MSNFAQVGNLFFPNVLLVLTFQFCFKCNVTRCCFVKPSVSTFDQQQGWMDDFESFRCFFLKCFVFDWMAIEIDLRCDDVRWQKTRNTQNFVFFWKSHTKMNDDAWNVENNVYFRQWNFETLFVFNRQFWKQFLFLRTCHLPTKFWPHCFGSWKMKNRQFWNFEDAKLRHGTNLDLEVQISGTTLISIFSLTLHFFPQLLLARSRQTTTSNVYQNDKMNQCKYQEL